MLRVIINPSVHVWIGRTSQEESHTAERACQKRGRGAAAAVNCILEFQFTLDMRSASCWSMLGRGAKKKWLVIYKVEIGGLFLASLTCKITIIKCLNLVLGFYWHHQCFWSAQEKPQLRSLPTYFLRGQLSPSQFLAAVHVKSNNVLQMVTKQKPPSWCSESCGSLLSSKTTSAQGPCVSRLMFIPHVAKVDVWGLSTWTFIGWCPHPPRSSGEIDHRYFTLFSQILQHFWLFLQRPAVLIFIL